MASSDLRTIAGNTVFIEIGPVVRDGNPIEIDASTGDSPILLTLAEAHGLGVGDRVRVSGHLLNGAANGEWEVASVPGGTTLTLLGSEGVRAGGGTGELIQIVPIDLTVADTKLWFTAKAKKSAADADAFISKANVAGGGTGITENLPASDDLNRATVEIDPADTEDVTASADYYYDVELEEPDGRRSTIARGTWKIEAATTRA